MSKKRLKKSKLIAWVAKETGLPYPQVDFIYETILDGIHKFLSEDFASFAVRGLGYFFYEPYERGVKSNLTGQIIPNHLTLKFRINAKLKKLTSLTSRKFYKS